MEFDFQMERSGFSPAMNALGDMPVCVVARDGTIQSFNRAIWEMTALLLAPGMATRKVFIATICSEIFTEMHGQGSVSLCKNIGGHKGIM